MKTIKISIQCKLAFVQLLICIFLVYSGIAGSADRTQFTAVNDGIRDSNIVIDNGLTIGIKKYGTVKIYGDSLPDLPISSNYSDIITCSSDTMAIYYADTIKGGIYYRNFTLEMNDLAAIEDWRKFCDADMPSDCYLHVDKGENGNLASFIQKGSGLKRFLRVHNGTRFLDIDSANGTGWLFSSQCHFDRDTFLVIYSVDMNIVKVKKIHSYGNTLEIVNSATVANGESVPGKSLMNCAIAADTQGMIIATYIKGTAAGNKFLHYTLLNGSLTEGTSDSLAELISDDNFRYYDDVSISSYALHKFAIVFWNTSGLYMSRISTNGMTATHTTGLLAAGQGFSHCATASKSNYLLVMCKGDMNRDGIAGIEGMRYPVSEGNFGLRENFVFTNNPVEVRDQFSYAINCVMDNEGSIGLTWRHKNSIQSTVWAYRGIRHARAFWTSPVESLTLSFPDSIQYYPLNVGISSSDICRIEDSIRVGCTIGQLQSSQWVPFSDMASLAGKKTTCKYYQYRIALIRRTDGSRIDSITTPVINSCTVNWNIKPVLYAIDSIHAGNRNLKNVLFGDSISIFSRSDTVSIFASVRDLDTGDIVSCRGASLSDGVTRNISGGGPASVLYRFLPVNRNGTAICTLSIADSRGWAGSNQILHLKVGNELPEISISAVLSGNNDVVKITRDTSVVFQENDSIQFEYSVLDTNDQNRVKGYILRRNGTLLTKLDSTSTGVDRKFTVRGDTLSPTDTMRLQFSAVDPDTSVNISINSVINHFPSIASCHVNSQEVYENDSVRMNIGIENVIEVTVHDTDVTFWDTNKVVISIGMVSDTLMSVPRQIRYTCIPAITDSQIIITVLDRYNKIDSLSFTIIAPWFADDSTINPGFYRARDTLFRHISMIGNDTAHRKIKLPLLNAGNDDLKITGCAMKGNSRDWLYAVMNEDTAASGKPIVNSSVTIHSGDSVHLFVFLTAYRLIGDGLVYDTLLLYTDDPSHRIVQIPICLEYNDLPRIVSIKPSFISGVPYWMLSKRKEWTSYIFPPHAAVEILFSEPIDTNSVISGVAVYSVFDLIKTGSLRSINLKREWSQNNTRLRISADYTFPSEHFGIQPPEGLFIPTDSLAVVLNSSIVDIANTPGGPNPLDVHRNYQRVIGADTTINLRVDSIGFSVAEILPEPSDTNIGSQQLTIQIRFTAPVYVSKIDRSVKNNRSLVITSRYNGNKQIDFDTVMINNNVVTFTVAKKLFYRDELTCVFKSNTVLDTLGYPTDNNKNGIPITIFDSTSTEDDLQWSYKVRDIKVLSVSPADRSTTADVRPDITLTFSEPLFEGVFDTDTTRGNKSLLTGSLYSSELSGYESIRFSEDRTRVFIKPSFHFFSSDSVYCKFRGFRTEHSYDSAENYPHDNDMTFCDTSWYFYSGNVGFYTYPNPYKPGSSSRHCSNGGPCGIWFKNLHTIKRGLQDVVIRVFDMNTNPIFDTSKKGIRIHFETGKGTYIPQWFWDTRNMKNELVASGLYLYTISDLKGHVLLKDKLIIVR